MAVSDLGKARKYKAEQERKADQERKMTQAKLDLARYGRVDLPLLFLLLVLLSFGLIMLFSASLSSAYADWGDPLYYVRRQFVFTIVGCVAIIVLTRIPLKVYNRMIFAIAVYAVSTLSLLLVMFAGVVGDYGATRWLAIGPIQFQPSEMCKVAAIYCLAIYFPYIRKCQEKGRWIAEDAREQVKIDGRLYIIAPVMFMGLWFVLIAAQPHLSGALIFFGLVFSMFIFANIPLKTWISGLIQILPLLLIAVILLTFAYPLLNDGDSFFTFISERFAHVFARLETFSNPEEASRDSIHQTLQARFALGSGGLTGKGLGMGQQKSGFLPMVYNDFILPSIGEELGFLGSFSVIVLFFLFFFFGMRITLQSNSQFAALLSWGSTVLITIQALFNIGVAAEVIPPTGISLPFFSYGGSSHIFFLLAVGFILSVSRNGQKLDPALKAIIVEDNKYVQRLSRRRKASRKYTSSLNGQ